MEVRKSLLVAALHLELGILPDKYEIEIKQLLFLKRIIIPYVKLLYFDWLFLAH